VDTPVAPSAGPDVTRPVAVVTGAGRGLGRAVAKRLGSGGWDIVLVARSRDQVTDVADELADHGAAALVLGGDVCDTAMPARIVGEAVGRFGRIDALINNAARYQKCEATSLTAEEWALTLDVNLGAPFRLAAAVATQMIAAGRAGSIVNVGSIFGLAGVSGTAAYAASKGGLVALTRALAVEWGRHDVRVNLVAPGHMRTELNAAELQTEASQTFIRRNVPLRRVAEPEDVAGLVVYLASPDARFITGSVMVCDGGYTAR